VQFAVEFAQQGALAVGHVPDGVEMLSNLMRPLLVAAALLLEDVREQLSGLLEAAGGAVLRLGLRQQIQGDDEERVDGVVRARQVSGEVRIFARATILLVR